MKQAVISDELAKLRATAALRTAITAAKRKDFINAFISYGEALTYEFIYDLAQTDIELHSLYLDSGLYKNLVLEWSALLNEPDSILETAKMNAPVYRDRYTMHDF